ncbi:MAG: hypothetical protein ACPGTG_03435 [Flavobacteriales bacterium]
MKKNALEYFDKLANEKSLEQCFRSIVSYYKSIPSFESVNLKEGTIDLWDIPSYDENFKPSLHTRKIIDLFAFEVETEAKKVISEIKQEVEGLIKSGIDSKMYLEYITKSLNNYSEIVKDKYQSTPFVLDSITQILKEVNILLPKVKEQIEIDNFSKKHNIPSENTKTKGMKVENPLYYFDNLIHYYDYDHEFTGFYADFIIDLDGNIISLDEKNDQIVFKDPDNNQKVTTTSYKSFFEGEVQKETKKAIKNIQDKILSISEVNDPGFFIESISKILLSYLELAKVKFKTTPFVAENLKDILKETKNRFIEINSNNTLSNTNYKFYSFKFLKPEKLEILFQLMIENGLIESSKSDFFNAFSGQEVNDGIKWMVKGKNGYTSKTSLFHFLEQLIDKKLLHPSILNDLNKCAKYVFRDSKGNFLKNLKVSRATASTKVSQEYVITSILSDI